MQPTRSDSITLLTMKFPLGRTGTALISAALLCACSSSNPPSNVQAPFASSAPPSPSVSATTPAASATAPPLNSLLKKDMAYADARKALLAQGWAPEKDAQCKANVGASEALCKDTPDLTVCRICDELPELSAYSDSGDAVTHFTRKGQHLTLRASGSISDWKVSGDDSRLGVTGWQVSK